jgi:hypothetical protein
MKTHMEEGKMENGPDDLVIDYASVLVSDFSKAVRCFRDLLGVEDEDAIIMEEMIAGGEKENCALLKKGGCYLEIISPCNSCSRLGTLLDKRGEGLHHLNLAAKDLGKEMMRLSSLGFEFVFEGPLEDMFGCKYNFLNPKFTFGVLIGIGDRWERDGKNSIRPAESRNET